ALDEPDTPILAHTAQPAPPGVGVRRDAFVRGAFRSAPLLAAGVDGHGLDAQFLVATLDPVRAAQDAFREHVPVLRVDRGLDRCEAAIVTQAQRVLDRVAVDRPLLPTDADRVHLDDEPRVDAALDVHSGEDASGAARRDEALQVVFLAILRPGP